MEKIFGIDLRSLALFRVGLGSILLADIAMRARDLEAHYTDLGVVPRFLVTDAPSAHLLTGTVTGEAILFAAAALFALFVIAGYRTRLSVAVSWLLLVSVQNRNWLVGWGQDDLLRLCLFWAMFLPLGERKEGGRHLSVATAALLLQVAMMYWTTALLKTSPEWRSDGTAIYFALGNEQVTSAWGQWLRHFPALLKPLTISVWYFELLGLFFLFAPWARVRLAAIVGFFALQLGLFTFMSLGFFPIISSIALLPFIPSEAWGPLERTTRSLRLSNALAGFFLAYVTCLNLSAVTGVPFMARLDRLTQLFRLDQDWFLFAPRPYAVDGWIVIPGLLADSTDVDVYHRKEIPVSWDKPAIVSASYADDRWASFLWRLVERGNSDFTHWYAEYLCRTWNQDRVGMNRLAAFRIFFVLKRVPRENEDAAPKLREAWAQTCD